MIKAERAKVWIIGLQKHAIRPTALEAFGRFHARGNDLELCLCHLANNRLSHEQLPPAFRLPVRHNKVEFAQPKKSDHLLKECQPLVERSLQFT